MPFFELEKDKVGFPPGHFADEEGLLAQGGDLTAEWLKASYSGGLLLWFSPLDPYRWWCPDPRIVLYANEIAISDELKNKIDSHSYTITFNQDLTAALKICEKEYNQGPMTQSWITGVFVKAFKEYSEIGNVQTAEVWENNVLVGCIFGAVVGKLFLGEFVCGMKDGVKEIALISLVHKLKNDGVIAFDLTKETMTTQDVGYREISRTEFLNLLS